MGRLTKYGETSHENGVCCTHFNSAECQAVAGNCAYDCKWEEEVWSKLAHYEDLEEQGRLITTHEAAVVLAETFGYEHPCNFNGIDEWFPDVCHLAEMCPDGKTAIIACWEQYFKAKLKELKEGAE